MFGTIRFTKSRLSAHGVSCGSEFFHRRIAIAFLRERSRVARIDAESRFDETDCDADHDAGDSRCRSGDSTNLRSLPAG